jgi:hypothetical protein
MRVRRLARAVRRRLPMALSTETEVTSGIRGSSTDVVPTGAALGATVKGVDLKDHVVSRSAAEGEHALLP